MSSSKQSELLLHDSSPMIRESRFFPTSISSLPKIPRIQHNTASTEPSDSTTTTATNYPKIIITPNDALRIFQGSTILFVGDPFLRILYHDLVKLFSTGRLLEQSEAAIQHGEYRPNPSKISDFTICH